MMTVTIEVIYGRLMTKLVVVFHMLSMIHGLTIVKKIKTSIIMILATICTQEKVTIQKNNAIICQIVNINVMIIVVKNGAIMKNLILLIIVEKIFVLMKWRIAVLLVWNLVDVNKKVISFSQSILEKIGIKAV
jgi:hypothetical protein